MLLEAYGSVDSSNLHDQSRVNPGSIVFRQKLLERRVTAQIEVRE